MTEAVGTVRSGSAGVRSRPVVVDAPIEESVGDVSELSAGELADVMATFTSVTEQLQRSHLVLQSEVKRLKDELRETNEQLRRSRELAALGQMAAGIAHEVRNPLGTIRLFSSMLADDLSDRPEPRSLAMKITQSVDDLDVFVTDVLALAREMRLRVAEVDPWVVLSEAIDSCEDILKQAEGVTVHRVGERDSFPHLTVDPLLMQQVLSNLVRNAVESMEDRPGALTCSVRLESDDRISFVVEDEGCGIDPDVLEQVFNPFFTTRRAGTGLGLAIAHRIVEAHSGEIRIESVFGEGSVVVVFVPLGGVFEE